MIDPTRAKDVLEYVEPLLRQAEESVIKSTLRAYKDGALEPNQALAAWARLAGLREVPAVLQDTVAAEVRRQAEQIRAALQAA